MKNILQIAFAIFGLAAPAINPHQVTSIRQIDFDNFSSPGAVKQIGSPGNALDGVAPPV
jgi:hypothetical protein